MFLRVFVGCLVPNRAGKLWRRGSLGFLVLMTSQHMGKSDGLGFGENGWRRNEMEVVVEGFWWFSDFGTLAPLA